MKNIIAILGLCTLSALPACGDGVMDFLFTHDGYVYEGFEIPIYYDPMIAKLISYGPDRVDAMKKLKNGCTNCTRMT